MANRKDNVHAADRPYVEFSLADGWTKSATYATTNAAPVTVSQRWDAK